MVTVEMLKYGGTRWKEQLEESLRRSGISTKEYNAGKGATIRKLVQQKLLMPLYVNPASSYGERWRNLFQMLANTEDYQIIIVARNFFFPFISNHRLVKKWNLLPAKKGEDGANLSVREAMEAGLGGFTLESVDSENDVLVGIGFAGTEANSHLKVTTPYNWLRGRKWHDSLEHPLELQYVGEGKQLTIKLRMGRQDQAFELGILVEAEVPSFEGREKSHSVQIKNLPIYSEADGIPVSAKKRGYDIFVVDHCERNFYSDEKFGRKMLFGDEKEIKNENELDHHFVMVVEAAASLIRRQYPGLAIDNPIPSLIPGIEPLVDQAFRRIIVAEPSKNKETMLWESTNLMQVYTMMAWAYLNSKKMAESQKSTALT